ncbi:ADP-ribosylation factor-like protein 2-binding protein [Asbolus verrucosus]|uniref:ADP-ribosylation factor-like protein 2-binding protein n=1 Tax=Asbolus verrucosus TaxID=1661398 RepID=A0A482VEA5_ASBVE|nr:ADP-ribosylation factor-like protein 2-binding protein [Asbolus verrucosus]
MATEQCPYDDLDISHRCLEASEKYFAQVIGCIEDILMDENFLNLHTEFMEEHWQEFDEGEENKLVYSDIFEKYLETIEKYIETELKKAIPEFKMLEFEYELRYGLGKCSWFLNNFTLKTWCRNEERLISSHWKRHNELEGEIFEILSTFSDFVSFKEKFLDYKAMKEGKTADFSEDFSIIQYKLENL